MGSQREYFSRFVAPRNKRLLPQTAYGITRHHFHRKELGNPDGCDDEPHPAEALLTDAKELSVPPVPSVAQGVHGQGRLPPLQQAAQIVTLARPDGSFDHWGE